MGDYYLEFVYKLKFVILGLDPGIQNILKRMDSRK
jgi:hypothetical protein